METCKTTKVSCEGATSTTTIRQEVNVCYAVVKSLPQIILLICLTIFCVFGYCLLKPAATTTCNCKDVATMNVCEQLIEIKTCIAEMRELKNQIADLSLQKEELRGLKHSVENLTKRFHCRCCWKRKWDILMYLEFPSVKKCCHCD